MAINRLPRPALLFAAAMMLAPVTSAPAALVTAVGVQLIGRHLDEALLCRAGHAFQTVTDWHRRHPVIA